MATAELDAMDVAAAAKVAEAEEAAKAAPEPDPAGIDKQVWSDGGSAWRN